MAHPLVCKKKDLSKRKSLRVRVSSKNCKMKLSGRDGTGDESSAFLTACSPRRVSILVYRESTSMEKISVLRDGEIF